MKKIIYILTSICLLILVMLVGYLFADNYLRMEKMEELTKNGKGSYEKCKQIEIGDTLENVVTKFGLENNKINLIDDKKVLYFNPEWKGDDYSGFDFASKDIGQSSLVFDLNGFLINKTCKYLNASN